MWNTHDPGVRPTTMTIILTVTSPTLDSDVDPRFGRGAYLLLVDPQTMEWSASPNPGLNARGGAGIKAAEYVSTQGVDAVISGDFGPNAFQALSSSGLSMYLFGECRTAREVIEQYNSGQLKQVPGTMGGDSL
jgi:predicted Fe-Mo cluster-binding NifX family protein